MATLLLPAYSVAEVGTPGSPLVFLALLDVLCLLRGRIPSQPRDAPLELLEHSAGRPLVAPDEPVEVDHAVEVVGLVLQAPGQEPAALHRHRRPVDVRARDTGPLRTAR